MDANTGQFMPLTTAKRFVEDYNNLPGSGPIKAHGFGKNKLLDLLNQPNAIGARIYYGSEQLANGTFEQRLVVVGVNANNEDILNTSMILDFSAACPPNCPPPNHSLLP